MDLLDRLKSFSCEMLFLLFFFGFPTLRAISLAEKKKKQHYYPFTLTRTMLRITKKERELTDTEKEILVELRKVLAVSNDL